jgi:hypothetical protein
MIERFLSNLLINSGEVSALLAGQALLDPPHKEGSWYSFLLEVVSASGRKLNLKKIIKSSGN